MSGRQALANEHTLGNLSAPTAYRRALQQAHEAAAARAGAAAAEQRFADLKQTERAPTNTHASDAYRKRFSTQCKTGAKHP